jgi:hypothetical protein
MTETIHKQKGNVMKKLTIAFVFLFAWQSSAQLMVIHQKGQPDVSYVVAHIAKLTFSVSGTTGIIQPMVLKNIKSAIANIYPNLFSARIEYSVDKPAMVKIQALDMLGRVVRTITNARMDSGHYSTKWDFCNDAGFKVGKGTYIVNVEISGQRISKSLFVVN